LTLQEAFLVCSMLETTADSDKTTHFTSTWTCKCYVQACRKTAAGLAVRDPSFTVGHPPYHRIVINMSWAESETATSVATVQHRSSLVKDRTGY